MKLATTFAWGQMLDALLSAGLTPKAIGDAMGFQLSPRMIEHYRRGVQPLHWRGEGLLALWCKTLRQPRDQAPKAPTNPDGKARGQAMPMHRAAMQLPAFPVGAKKRGRPRKVAAP